jgi:hypothetical protein
VGHPRPPRAVETGNTRHRFRRRPCPEGHRARHHPSARERAPDCLASRPPGQSPGSRQGIGRLLLAALSRTAAFQAPGRPRQAPGDHPGRRSPSQVSRGLRPAGHVARGRYPSGPSPYVPGPRPGIVSARSPSRFRGAEVRSASPTPRRRLFAVRHRLRPDSPASPCGPFMVELFAAPGLAGGPRARSRPGPACRQARSSPRRHG